MAEMGKGVTAGKLASNVQKTLTRAQEKVKLNLVGIRQPIAQEVIRHHEAAAAVIHLLVLSALPYSYQSSVEPCRTD
ncbi:UNVERIFIED_CONTAM: hypothetical protein FKN15_012871 [Acipenser sinensis]